MVAPVAPGQRAGCPMPAEPSRARLPTQREARRSCGDGRAALALVTP
jgi:hypothetical protein